MDIEPTAEQSIEQRIAAAHQEGFQQGVDRTRETVVHLINNDIAPLVGYTDPDFLSNFFPNLTPEQQQVMAEISTAAKQIEQTVVNLRQITPSTATHVTGGMEIFDIREIKPQDPNTTP